MQDGYFLISCLMSLNCDWRCCLFGFFCSLRCQWMEVQVSWLIFIGKNVWERFFGKSTQLLLVYKQNQLTQVLLAMSNDLITCFWNDFTEPSSDVHCLPIYRRSLWMHIKSFKLNRSYRDCTNTSNKICGDLLFFAFFFFYWLALILFFLLIGFDSFFIDWLYSFFCGTSSDIPLTTMFKRQVRGKEWSISMRSYHHFFCAKQKT
jgi:hypothetical protein